MAYLNDFAMQLGIPLWIFVIVLIWTLTWKLIAMWKSAKNNHVAWFIVLAIVNTVGILEILYIYVFSKFGKKEKKIVKNSSKKKRR